MVAVRLMRILGLAMFAYGAIMLALLFSPQKQWALDHSIAEMVSATDRRANNEIDGSVDEPIAYAGSAVMMFAGLWFAFLVPGVIERNHQKMVDQIEQNRAERGEA